MNEWLRFVTDIFGRAVAYRPPRAADDSRADKACVYIQSEITYAVNRYGYAKSDVIAVGNPDLPSFGVSDSEIGLCLDRRFADNENVVYIETALFKYGLVYESRNEFVQHVIGTAVALSHQEKRLIFKPHPATDVETVSALSSAGIEFCSNESFVSSLRGCCACIVEPSSAVLVPALMGLPVFLAQYGSLSNLSFGRLIEDYPRSRSLTDMSTFNQVLTAEAAESDTQQTMAWIRQNVGPLPAEDMPRRIAGVLEAVLGKESHG